LPPFAASFFCNFRQINRIWRKRVGVELKPHISNSRRIMTLLLPPGSNWSQLESEIYAANLPSLFQFRERGNRQRPCLRPIVSKHRETFLYFTGCFVPSPESCRGYSCTGAGATRGKARRQHLRGDEARPGEALGIVWQSRIRRGPQGRNRGPARSARMPAIAQRSDNEGGGRLGSN